MILIFLSACRLLRSSGGSQDELLLLGILLSSSSVLISGLDEASLSNWTFELLCSVGSDSCILNKYIDLINKSNFNIFCLSGCRSSWINNVLLLHLMPATFVMLLCDVENTHRGNCRIKKDSVVFSNTSHSPWVRSEEGRERRSFLRLMPPKSFQRAYTWTCCEYQPCFTVYSLEETVLF